MFTRTRKALAVSVALIFVTGLAVYAQTQPKPRTPKQRPAIAGQQQAGQQQRPNITPEQKRELALRFVSLQRLLRPPTPQEMQRMAMMLSLTEEQKQSIKALYEQFVAKTKPAGEARGAAVKEVLNALQSPVPSKGDLQSSANKVEQADRTVLDAEFDFWIGFKGIMSSQQQQTQINTYMQQRAAQEFGGPRAGGPGAPPAPVK